MFSNEDYLAELLAEAGMVSPDDVAHARNALSGGETIVEHLLAHTSLTQDNVAKTLAANAGIPFIRLSDVAFDPGITETISEEIAKRYRVIPVQDEGLSLTIAIADPLDFEALDTLPHAIGRELNLVCVTQQDIQDHLKQFYHSNEAASAAPEGYSVTGGDAEAGPAGDDAPIIKLVMQTLTEAFRLRASDIHIEPLETSVRIRYRLDGKLVHVDTHPEEAASGDHRPLEGHERHDVHRGKAPAAGRPDPVENGRQGGRPPGFVRPVESR